MDRQYGYEPYNEGSIPSGDIARKQKYLKISDKKKENYGVYANGKQAVC